MATKRWATSAMSLPILILIILGVGLRVYFYLLNRSLWLDEAMLALNLVNRSFVELLEPLSYNQGAPIGFLFIQKAMITVFGNSECSLRIFPLAAGVISIPMLYFVSKKINSGSGTVVALGLFVFSVWHTYYSSEVKQYTTDVLATLLILLVGINSLELEAKSRAIITFGMIACCAMWLSHASLFVIAAIFPTLLWHFAKQRDTKKIFTVFAVGLFFGLNLLLLYLVSLKDLSSNNYLLGFWKDAFAPIPTWQNLRWYLNAAGNLFSGPVGLLYGVVNGFPLGLVVVAGFLTAGIYSMSKKKGDATFMLALPAFVTLVASAFGKYPFSGRLLLFLQPIMYILLAEGIAQITEILRRYHRLVSVAAISACVLFLFVRPVLTMYDRLIAPPLGEDIKPVMEYLRENRSNSDQIYVYYAANPAFTYYAPFYGINDDEYVIGIKSREDPSEYIEDVKDYTSDQRVWFVFAHNCETCPENEQPFIIAYLDKIGHREGEYISEGAAIYRYNFELTSQ